MYTDEPYDPCPPFVPQGDDVRSTAFERKYGAAPEGEEYVRAVYAQVTPLLSTSILLIVGVMIAGNVAGMVIVCCWQLSISALSGISMPVSQGVPPHVLNCAFVFSLSCT